MTNVRSITPNNPADFTPELGNYKTLKPFRYWCQKVLPLVYDDSLSYYELLCKVVDYLNKTMEDVETLNGDVTNLHTTYEELQSYVNNYFSTLDVQEEINNKLDNMAISGELYEIIRRYTDPIVNEQNDEINVLKARMDTFASLPEGSTSSNAELTDIRVGYDGEVYPSAGDSVRKQVSKLNDGLRELTNLGTLYSENNCNYQGFYPVEPVINGLGFLMKNVPNFVHSINARCELTGNGIVKLDILDYNKNVIFSTSIKVTDYSSGVETLIFNVNEYITEEKIWIKIYSETLGIGRVEPTSINEKIVDTSNEYSAFLVNNHWNYGKQYNYIPYCTINGFIAKKSLLVGTDHKFTKIKDAVDYANNHINNEWDIFIDSGTYDIYSELGGNAWYNSITPSKGNMQGLTLGNNVNIIGIGNVKLTLNAPDNLATASNVPNLSVIELPNKNNIIENIDIECKNVRYGIHDETNGGQPNSKRYFKNISVKHNGCVSGTWGSDVSYGCGTSDNSYYEYENCIFYSGWLAHQNLSQTIPPNFIANNCRFESGSYAIALNTSGVCKANITFNNCYIDYMIRILEDVDIWSIFGSGNNYFNYILIASDKSMNPLKLYDITRIFKNTGTAISKGNAVSIYGTGVTNANDVKQVIGIALNNAEPNENVRVQLKGYYDCYSVAPFSKDNTLLGVSNGTIIENTSNYFGIGVYVDDLQQIYLLN